MSVTFELVARTVEQHVLDRLVLRAVGVGAPRAGSRGRCLTGEAEAGGRCVGAAVEEAGAAHELLVCGVGCVALAEEVEWWV